MNQIQLDEDCDAKHLVSACDAEGKVKALRFPRAMRRSATKDPAVLGTLIPKANPILTLDQGFAVDNSEHVPDCHAGIVIVALDPDAIPTITTHSAQRMLAEFKNEIPEWNFVNICNSIVLVRKSTVEISHCRSGAIVHDAIINRLAPGWQLEFENRLALNARRSFPV